MAVSDFNKQKKLDVDSVSGTPTVGKAQPISIIGEVTPKEFDGFEDGDFTSSPTWSSLDTGGTATVQTTTVKNGSNALKLNSNNSSFDNLEVEHDRGTSDGVSDGDVYGSWCRISSSSERAAIYLSNTSGDSIGNDAIRLQFNNDGTFALLTRDSTGGAVATNTGPAYNTGEWYYFTLELNPSNSEVTAKIYDDSLSIIWTSTASTSGATNIQYVGTWIAGASSSVAYFDDASYSTTDASSPYFSESDTGNGSIILDFTNISDAQDIAVYDQNDNLLDYEIEKLDTTAETAVLWAYNSWVRDGSTQAKVVYGDNSSNTDYQNVTATWGNTGQNAVMVQHLEESIADETTGNTVTDSTSNNNDGSVTGAQIGISGEFDGAGRFDGTDDAITISNMDFAQSDSTWTASAWAKSSTSGKNQRIFSSNKFDANWDLFVRYNSNDKAAVGIKNGSGNYNIVTSSNTYIDGNWHYLVGQYDASNDTLRLFVDGSQVGSITTTQQTLGVNDFSIGAIAGESADYFDGDIDDVKTTTDYKNSDWVQAEYDASPKAGQIFFKQQAAETTSTAVSATTTDSLAFTENAAVRIILTLTQSDSLTFTENNLSTLQFTDSDGLTFTENSTQTLANILSDDLTLTENTASKLFDTLVEDLGLKENVASQYIDTLTDNLTLTENLVIKLALTVTVSDTVSFSEQTDSLLQDIIAEQLGVSENLESVYFDTLSEQLKLQENSIQNIADVLSDTLGFSEQISTDLAAVITEQLDFTEDLNSTLETAFTETLNLSEEVSGALAALATDKLKFEENTEKALKIALQEQLGFNEEIAGGLAATVTDELTLQEQALFASLINIQGLTEAIITNKNRFVNMQNHTFKEGDFGDELNATLKDRDGAVDLSQVQKVDVVAQNRESVKVQDSQATITDGKNGKIEYAWSTGDIIETAGVYRMEFRVTDSAGNTETFPNDGYVTVEIEEEIG